MTHLASTVSLKLPLLLAQASGIEQTWSNLGTDLGSSLLNLLKAIGVFILGLIVAAIVKSIIKGLLNKTDIDNRIASWITGQRGGESIPVENWIANLVYWLIVLFAVVGFLNALELTAVSTPLNSLLNEITSFLPKILGAAFLVAIAWGIATIVKLLVTRGLGTLKLEERLGQQVGETSDFALTDTIGNALYWFIFLLFLPSILSTLNLEGTLAPVQSLVDEILAILPNILAALLIGAVGWLIAQVIRRLVTNLLSATGIDNIGAKFGLSKTGGTQSLSWIIGTVVFVLVLIPAIISALQALQIEAISAPATSMLDQVLDFVPKLFAAGVVLALAYMVGQYVSEFVSNILTGIGFNNVFQWLGISTLAPSTTTIPSPETTSVDTEQPTVIQTDSSSTKTPSEIVGIIAWIAIMLVAFQTAIGILNIDELTRIVAVLLEIAGQVLIALIIFAVGLYLANLAYNLVAGSGTYQAKTLAQAARVAIITLVSAMALDAMGVAPNIVNLAFGLLLGGIAVAIALAFGLGGREVAKEQLRSWVSSFKER